MAFPFARLLRRQPAAQAPAQRSASEAFHRSFDAATGGRRAGSLGTFGSVQAETSAASPLVARRAAYLAANNPWMANGVRNLVTYLAGSGARPAPLGLTREQKRALQRGFDRWAAGADHTGRTDFFGLQPLMAHDLVVHGETLALFRDDGDGLQLQVLPPDHLDWTKTAMLRDGGYIANGVEHDRQGRRVAYWILPERPTSPSAGAAPSVRIAAAEVLHVFHPLGPGQVRGVSWLAPAVLAASEVEQWSEALLVSAKVAALHAAFIRDTNDMSPDGLDGETTWEPGAISRLPIGTDITFTSPDQVKDAPDLMRMNLQKLAAALGLPEHLLSGDLSKANYSSLRAGLLPFRARIEQVQYATLVPQLFAPVWRRWLALEILSGGLDAPADTHADWIFPRLPQVDPAKDIAAVTEALAAGLMSRSQAISELGWNADDVDESIAADRDRETELGLSFTNKEAANAV